MKEHPSGPSTVEEMAAALQVAIQKLKGQERWDAFEAYGYFVYHHLEAD